ncbi:ABC transporter substrate-binding protein [Micropruina sp.]|uniref:ABC transporter substrate-binding protein n=1 Tax=Micropruina sp. TaxID=2737536 RepID=UPI0039E47DB5
MTTRKPKVLVGLLAATTLFGLVACSSPQPAASSAATSAPAPTLGPDARTVTDQGGATVQIPAKVERVADLWHANNQVILVLGAGDKLVATTNVIKQMKWFSTVYPKIADVTAPFSGDELQIEELVKLKPDAVLSSNDAQIQSARNAGLPAVKVNFQTFDGLRDTVKLTAEVLGGDAPARAEKYLTYLDKNIATVETQLKGLKDADRPSVLHIAGPTDLLTVDGRKSMIDEWINLAGGRNALETEGNLAKVTMETIVASDPDVIIIGSTSSEAALELLRKDPAYSQLRAVKAGKVYGNPRGTFPWDRYSAEEALQVLWVAQLLHPEKFKNLDMVAETQKFYKNFLDYDLSADQAKLILAGKDPA